MMHFILYEHIVLAFIDRSITELAPPHTTKELGVSVENDSIRSIRTTSVPQLKAVVANFHRTKDTGWLRLNSIPTEEVGTCLDADGKKDGLCGLRSVGEARPWLQWIIHNYNNLGAQYLAFLHGDRHTWHVGDVLSRIRTAKPANVEMIADRTCNWKPSTGQAASDGAEGPGLNVVARALWGKSFVEVWNTFGMAMNYVCCAEMVVNSDAVKKIDKRIFQALLSMMEKDPRQPWGWVMERTWQNLFSRPIVRSVEEIEAAFANFSYTKLNAATDEPSGMKPGEMTDDWYEMERSKFLAKYMANPVCLPGQMRWKSGKIAGK